jgi:hypothetical protein
MRKWKIENARATSTASHLLLMAQTMAHLASRPAAEATTPLIVVSGKMRSIQGVMKMPSPSDLPWWGWFLCAFGAGIISLAAFAASEKKDTGCLGYLVGILGIIAGFLFGIIGIIRLVKWIWES